MCHCCFLECFSGMLKVILWTRHTSGARPPCAICWLKKPRFAAYDWTRWAVAFPSLNYNAASVVPFWPPLHNRCLCIVLFLFFSFRGAGTTVLWMPKRTGLRTSSSSCQPRLRGTVSITSSCLSELITDPGESSTPLCCCWITREFIQ